MCFFYLFAFHGTVTVIWLVNIAGVFALLHAYAALKYLQSFMTKSEFRSFFLLAIAAAAGLVFLGVVGLTWAGTYCFRIFSFGLCFVKRSLMSWVVVMPKEGWTVHPSFGMTTTQDIRDLFAKCCPFLHVVKTLKQPSSNWVLIMILFCFRCLLFFLFNQKFATIIFFTNVKYKLCKLYCNIVGLCAGVYQNIKFSN